MTKSSKQQVATLNVRSLVISLHILAQGCIRPRVRM